MRKAPALLLDRHFLRPQHVVFPQNRPKLNNSQAEQLRSQMSRINKALSTYHYSFGPAPILRRQFEKANDTCWNWNKGGRLYVAIGPNFQNFKKAERAGIKFNGETTVEIDVSASILTIYLGLCGVTDAIESDPYDIEGLPRELTKHLLVNAFGGERPPKQWGKGFKAEYEQETGLTFPAITASQGWAMACKKHPILREFEERAIYGATLEFHESQAIVGTMNKLLGEGICVLPIHDSLIVPKAHSQIASELLSKAYVESASVKPTIKGIE